MFWEKKLNPNKRFLKIEDLNYKIDYNNLVYECKSGKETNFTNTANPVDSKIVNKHWKIKYPRKIRSKYKKLKKRKL